MLPILLLRCTVCHGPRRTEGDLDLSSREAMLRGGKSGPAIVPGNAEQSLLVQRVRAEEMPPRRRLVEVSVKTMAPSELAVLERWIESGAAIADAVVGAAPGGAAPATDDDPSDDDRSFWAFQPPPPRLAVPVVRDRARVQGPIDAFVSRQLEKQGLSLAPEADRRTLIRRATFDLTGLPPTPQEIEAFVAAPGAAYERLIDRLLASTRYGERWGRIWLDVAGYADSEGKTEQDMFRPHAYRYRDYVVRAHNDDKPFDRFLVEQIAGDELADYENADLITQTLYDNLVATGFLRQGPDGTWANVTAFVPDRLEVVADAIDVLGRGVLGLTLNCARCHAHKFDPVSQHDYYRMAAMLKGAYDEHDWLKPQPPPSGADGGDDVRFLPYVTTEERREWDEAVGSIEAQVAKHEKALEAETVKFQRRYGDEQTEAAKKLKEEGIREQLKEAFPEFKIAAEEIEKKISVLKKSKPRAPWMRALWDRGIPSPTYLLRRGDYLSAREPIAPGIPAVFREPGADVSIAPPWPGANKSGRRLALARWLVQPRHPLTARVAVNRIWKYHFEHGLVRSLGNFGRTGTRPSHPELLDWLASEFVRGGWSMKALHRSIMISAVYRQTSAISAEARERDPRNVLLSRFPLKRLEAESLRDSILFVAGRLDETPFGPSDAVDVRSDGLVTAVGTSRGWRRSIYVRQRRKQIPTILEAFDLPQMNPNCLERPNSTVATQALHLLNNRRIQELAGAFATRLVEEPLVQKSIVQKSLLQEPGDGVGSRIEHAFWLALGRAPTTPERAATIETYERLLELWRSDRGEGNDVADPGDAPRRALENICHALINSAEFIHVD